MREEFTDTYKTQPAKIFTSTLAAMEFTALLARLDISYWVKLVQPRKRLKLPMQTIVVLVGVSDGIQH